MILVALAAGGCKDSEQWETRMLALKPTDEVDFSRHYTLEEFWALPEREDHARYLLIKGRRARQISRARRLGSFGRRTL